MKARSRGVNPKAGCVSMGKKTYSAEQPDNPPVTAYGRNGRPIQSDSTFFNVLSDQDGVQAGGQAGGPAIGQDGWGVQQSNRAAEILQMRPSSAMFGAYSRALDTIPFDGEPQAPPPARNVPENEATIAEKKQEAVRVWPSRILQGKLAYARVIQSQQPTGDEMSGSPGQGSAPASSAGASAPSPNP